MLYYQEPTELRSIKFGSVFCIVQILDGEGRGQIVVFVYFLTFRMNRQDTPEQKLPRLNILNITNYIPKYFCRIILAPTYSFVKLFEHVVFDLIFVGTALNLTGRFNAIH